MTQDLGTTPRKRLTRTQRLKLYEDHKGLCGLCGLKIERGSAWIDEHMRPLALAGGNELDNRRPVHVTCAAAKTSVDIKAISKAKAVKAKSLGIKAAPAKPLQGKGFTHTSSKRDRHPMGLPERRGGIRYVAVDA